MPYVVNPTPNPNAGFGQDLLKQAIMALITQGASLPFQGLGQVAKAGMYTSPTGQRAMFSPAERVASNPSMSAAQMVSQSMPPGASFNPTRMGIGRVPDYATELNRIKVQNAPLERQQTQASIDSSNAISGLYGQMNKIKQVEDDALQGKPGAAEAYRYLKSIGAI